MNIFFSWIGGSDRKAAETGDNPEDMGAIARALRFDKLRYDKVVLLADGLKVKEEAYLTWLKQYYRLYLAEPLPSLVVKFCNVKAMDRAALYELMQQQIETDSSPNDQRTYLLSSGTPAMHLCWTLLAHTQRYQARLIDSSKQEGIKEVPHWIELAHAFLPKVQDVSSAIANWCAEVDQSDTANRILGVHPSIIQAKALAGVTAAMPPDDCSVLILGETGTGKENIARLIHELSNPKTGQFLAINCGAMPEALLESELFGHKKGAYTGANTDHKGIFETVGEHGTVFLDEIGDMPLLLQTKVLRVLQERTIRPVGSNQEIAIPKRRIIAATHKSLITGIAEGWFREDLYYRLNVVEIRLLPLRDRLSDLHRLTSHFLETINQSLTTNGRLQAVSLADDAYAVLLAHSWSGNIRELENTLKRAVVHANLLGLGTIDAQLLKQLILPSTPANDLMNQPLANVDLTQLCDKLRYHYYQRFMQEQPQIGRETLAQQLGVTPPTLRKLEDDWKTQGLTVWARQERKKS
jgi:transcriptional regulator with PAS, ATPase and Fis domain